MSDQPPEAPAPRHALSGIDDEYFAFIQEVFGANERAGAIVAVAQVEDQLRTAIVTLNALTATEEKTLFEGTRAPLTSLFAKIHIGYSLGLFTEAVRGDLIVVKDVRNLFAHQIGIRTFKHPRVVSLCARLNYPHTIASQPQGARQPVDLSDARDTFERTTSHLHYMLRVASNVFFRPGLVAIEKGFIHYDYRPGAHDTSQKKARARPTNRSPSQGRRSPKRGDLPQS